MRIVCIAGIHRSGTSLVSRLVNLLGVDLGPPDELMAPQPDNPKGFWENVSITALNDDLLAELGGTWKEPPTLEEGWEKSPQLDPFRERAKNLIDDLFVNAAVAGWKDPRMSLLLPFWRTVAPIDKTIISIRDPRAVAASLFARDSLDGERSAELWLRYVFSAWCNDADRYFIAYEDLFDAFEDTVDSLANFLGLPVPAGDELESLRNTVDPSLRHHSHLTESESSLMALAVRAFDAIRHGEVALVGAVADELQRRWNLESQVSELTRETEQTSAQLADANDRILARDAQLEGTQAQLDAVTASFGWQVYQRAARRLRAPGTRRAEFILRARPAVRRAFAKLGLFSDLPDSLNERSVPELLTEFSSVTLPFFDHPVVSVIVPVHGQEIYTYNCLRAVAEASNTVPLEVIVVDDASGPETTEMLQMVENVRVVRNEENQGFLRSANIGVEQSSGEFLVFLNNDTLVKDGWLDALVNTVRSAPDVGLVGAKLVFPDGSLQDAGGIIFTDGTGMNYGKWQEPASSEYNFVRDTDYCSAACCLVRRDAFESVGGLDEHFRPAYYEDTDLAFALRQSGYRVVYQPLSEVIHFEGASHGTDITQGGKSSQETNRKKFVAKWHQVLEDRHLPPDNDPIVARYQPLRDVVVVADHHVPTHDQDSGSKRMFALLSILRELGHNVVFMPADLDRKEPYTRDLQQLGVEVLYGSIDPAQHLKRIAPIVTTCIVSRIGTATRHLRLLRESLPDAQFVFDTVDLSYLREERRLEAKGKTDHTRVERLRRQELEIARSVDRTWVVTDDEKRTLSALLPDCAIDVVPNVHDEKITSTPFTQRSGLLFIGSFLHPPNEAAVIHLCESILPLIKQKLPDIHLHIVGTRPGEGVRALASSSVTVTGWVKDLDPYLEKCRVAVAPLTYGAGLKGKVGQTLGSGLPTVMTPTAAEGLNLRDGTDAFIAEDPEDFAARVIRLYEDEALWNSMAQRGVEVVSSRFSSHTVKTLVAHALESLHDDHESKPEPARSLELPLSQREAGGVRARKRELVQDPLIILGAPRSGTTYLKQILNQHPDVHISHETRVFIWVHRALNVLPGKDRVLLLHKDRFLTQVRSEIPDMIRRFYSELPETRGRTIWGDKNPHYAAPEDRGCLDTILELFPGARFIHIVRDGRDVITSLIRKKTPDGEPWIDWEGAHRIWGSHLRTASDFGQEHPDLFYELKYEDLIADDLTVTSELFSWLGLELTENVKTFCIDQKHNRTPFSEPARDLSLGVTRSDWESILSPQEQLQSLELLSEQLILCGYETEESLQRIRSEILQKT